MLAAIGIPAVERKPEPERQSRAPVRPAPSRLNPEVSPGWLFVLAVVVVAAIVAFFVYAGR